VPVCIRPRPKFVLCPRVMDDPSTASPPPRRRISAGWRVVMVIGLFVGLYGLAALTGADEYLTEDRLRSLIENAGVWGWLLFLTVFAVGELMHIPGVVFVGAVSLVYPPLVGVPLAYAGAIVSVVASFWVVRGVGGSALSSLDNRWVKRALAGLDAKPIRTVIVLRLLLWMAPALNYALAMTNIRFRAYLIGSSVGLVLPIVAVALFFYGAIDFFR